MAMKVIILRGGIFGGDGPWTSAGMDALARRIPGASVYNWSDLFTRVLPVVQAVPKATKLAVIGYSGGGSRGTWIGYYADRPIDLLVGYDPSPASECRPLRRVAKAICYHNKQTFLWMLGAGRYVGANVTTYEISENHLAVQNDERLHRITLDALKELGNAVQEGDARQGQGKVSLP